MNWKVAILALVLVGCSSTKKEEKVVSKAEKHHNQFVVESHDHTHGKKCGHKMVKHVDHWDYLDGHEYHHAHNGHVDFHGLTKEGRKLASTNGARAEIKHEGHDHKHKKNCGHSRRWHGDHWDYLHGSHYHHGDKEHGSTL